MLISGYEALRIAHQQDVAAERTLRHQAEAEVLRLQAALAHHQAQATFTVRLTPFDAGFPSCGPFECVECSLANGLLVVGLSNRSVLKVPVPHGTIYALTVEAGRVGVRAPEAPAPLVSQERRGVCITDSFSQAEREVLASAPDPSHPPAVSPSRAVAAEAPPRAAGDAEPPRAHDPVFIAEKTLKLLGVMKGKKNPTLGMLAQAVLDLSAALAAARAPRACPCLHTTPCDPACTCVNPASSRGCQRCCSYGSPQQQQHMAESLVARAPRAERYADTATVFLRRRSPHANSDIRAYTYAETIEALEAFGREQTATLEAALVSLREQQAKQRTLLLKHAIKLGCPDVRLGEPRPFYRCQECQLSWYSERDAHPIDDECQIEAALRAPAAPPPQAPKL